MSAIFVLGANTEKSLTQLAAERGIAYDVEQNLTFEGVKSLIATKGPRTHIQPLSFVDALMCPSWFEVAVSAGYPEDPRLDFAQSTLLLHGKEKDDPWTAIQFKPIVSTPPSLSPFFQL